MDLPPSSFASSVPYADLTIEDLAYSLDDECPVPWPAHSEDAICQNYLFATTEAQTTSEEYVARLYLETLWLPESIRSLKQFVKSLRRIAPSPSQLKELHDALNPLLLSVRTTQMKYHQELPRILDDEGGAGELEEAMMWFARSKEKYPEVNEGSGQDAEESWKHEWMTKLERREVLIQILLYFHIISLPKPPPSTPLPTKKRKITHGPPTPAKPIFPPTSSIEAVAAAGTSNTPAKLGVDTDLSLEDRLEFFMDKLSLWQLVSSLGDSISSQTSTSQPTHKTQRDWMQIFCEDVVEPLFRDSLPELCELLRSKVFPHNVFSNESEEDAPPVPVRAPKKSKAKERRPPSPLRLNEIEKKPKAGSSRVGTSQASNNNNKDIGDKVPERHRSRSRSVSVSVDDMRVRGASRGGVASSKTLFRGEVEMKRTASKGSKLFQTTTGGKSTETRTLSRQASQSTNLFSTKPTPAPASPKEPKTFVADTPQKKRPQNEIMENFESPDPLALRDKFTWSPIAHGDDDEDELLSTQARVFVEDTPVKKRIL
ncbi:hypothetical protein M422DRAFT_774740 [Sphaerobolus stellatus SS14]|nr:hypothetical protein M422DRAFT_774740 [Sphaerobolus stellatus SS14]